MKMPEEFSRCEVAYDRKTEFRTVKQVDCYGARSMLSAALLIHPGYSPRLFTPVENRTAILEVSSRAPSP